MRTQKLLAGAILGMASLLGLAAFLYPFLLPGAAAAGAGGMAHAADAPLLFMLLLVLCLAAVFAALSGQQMTSKMVALLGVLTAMGAALRGVPGPGGFSGIFLLPILTGYCYGPAFGFLLGALGLAVSALIGGGVGPWLPYQMLSTGWVGLLSGWLPQRSGKKWEPVMLAAWGAGLGLAFGALMNLWFWPFMAGAGAGAGASAGPGGAVAGAAAAAANEVWQPGMSLWYALRNYLSFYVATSLWWDAGRAFGNAALLLLFGRPVLRVLRRFQKRFRFDVVARWE